MFLKNKNFFQKWLARTPGIYDCDEDLEIPVKEGDILYSTHLENTNDYKTSLKDDKSKFVRSVSEVLNYNKSSENSSSCNNKKNSDFDVVNLPNTNSEKNLTNVPCVKFQRLLSLATDDESSQTAIKRKTFWNRYLEAVNKYLEDMLLVSKVYRLLCLIYIKLQNIKNIVRCARKSLNNILEKLLSLNNNNF